MKTTIKAILDLNQTRSMLGTPLRFLRAGNHSFRHRRRAKRQRLRYAIRVECGRIGVEDTKRTVFDADLSSVAQFFHDHGTLWAVRLFEAITFFGNASTLGVIGLVTALVLAFQRRWSLLLGWATVR